MAKSSHVLPERSARSASGSTTCHSCPAGTYNTESGEASCVDCPAPGSGRAPYCADCMDAYHVRCHVMQAVDRRARSGSGSDVCAECVGGMFNSEAGSTTCDKCPTGSFASTSGMTECASCYPGTHGRTLPVRRAARSQWASATGASTDVCVDCIGGTFSSEDRRRLDDVRRVRRREVCE